MAMLNNQMVDIKSTNGDLSWFNWGIQQATMVTMVDSIKQYVMFGSETWELTSKWTALGFCLR